MSDSLEKIVSADAMSIEDQAADWSASRRMSTNWPQERQTELDAWLAQSPAHRVAYLRIEATWRRTARLAALREPMRQLPATEPIRRMTWHIAASFGIFLIAGIIAENYFSRPHGQLIETPRGGQERLLLADGSRVELNTDSAIRVDLSGRTRAVELLRGEAYFQVKHDAQRPFVVTAGSHKVIDLGTKFLMRMAQQSLHVMLMEGKAQLESIENGAHKAVVLSPGDVALATAETMKVTKRPVQELSDSLAWQHGAIIFRNERLADAVAEFNRYGGQQLVVADGVTANLKINGTFQTGGAEDFAGITHEIFGLHVKRQDGKIVLSR